MSSSYRDDGKGKRWTGSQDRRESIRAPLLAKIQACYTFYGLALTCGQILEHRTHESGSRLGGGCEQLRQDLKATPCLT